MTSNKADKPPGVATYHMGIDLEDTEDLRTLADTTETLDQLNVGLIGLGFNRMKNMFWDINNDLPNLETILNASITESGDWWQVSDISLMPDLDAVSDSSMDNDSKSSIDNEEWNSIWLTTANPIGDFAAD